MTAAQAKPLGLMLHPQPYPSFSVFARTHRLQFLPKPREDWRLVAHPVIGNITGLSHKFHGLAIATNGIIVAILTSANAIFFGHLQWFVQDDESEEMDLYIETSGKSKKVECLKEFSELFE